MIFINEGVCQEIPNNVVHIDKNFNSLTVH